MNENLYLGVCHLRKAHKGGLARSYCSTLFPYSPFFLGENGLIWRTRWLTWMVRVGGDLESTLSHLKRAVGSDLECTTMSDIIGGLTRMIEMQTS